MLATAKLCCCSHGNASFNTHSRPPLPQTMQVALAPLGLVSMQALLISRSTTLVKLPFPQKATPVFVIVDLACIQDYE